MESFHEAWDLICDYCKAHITDVAYKTWISRIEPVKLDFDAGDAILMVPNEFHRQTLNRCYMPLLNSAVHEIFGSGINIIFTIPNEAGEKKAAPNDNLAIDSEYEFTFDTYIVGSSNKFAHAASLAVAANPAGAYNPLFIYGNSGLGKTHLLYAICNDLKRSHPEMTTLYIKGDDFTNELIDAIQHGTTSTFHQKYRKTDVLLVDDIQFIAGKDSTQEEFFHTFNSLYEAKKQIVLTSDRPPKEIQTLEDRLRTRFEWGLIADIQPPDFETRIAIIKRKAEALDLELPGDVCEYIATRLKTNIRQLEGAVKKMKANWLLNGDAPTMANAQTASADGREDHRGGGPHLRGFPRRYPVLQAERQHFQRPADRRLRGAGDHPALHDHDRRGVRRQGSLHRGVRGAAGGEKHEKGFQNQGHGGGYHQKYPGPLILHIPVDKLSTFHKTGGKPKLPSASLFHFFSTFHRRISTGMCKTAGRRFSFHPSATSIPQGLFPFSSRIS